MIIYHQNNRGALAGSRIAYWGFQPFLHFVFSSTTTETATLNLRVVLGSDVLLASGDVAIPSSGVDVPWKIEGMFIVRTVAGFVTTLMATGEYDNGQSSGLLRNAAAVSADPTLAADLKVTAQWGTKHVDNVVTVQNLELEKVG